MRCAEDEWQEREGADVVRRHVVILLVEANDFLMTAYVAQHSLCQGPGGVSGGRQLATHGGNQAWGSRVFIDEVLAVQHF